MTATLARRENLWRAAEVREAGYEKLGTITGKKGCDGRSSEQDETQNMKSKNRQVQQIWKQEIQVFGRRARVTQGL